MTPDQQILPVTGTREALFAFAQAMSSHTPGNYVLMPNPFYQIYEGAALLAGLNPVFVANDPALGYQQNFNAVDETIWQNCEIVYLCSPGNPTGQIIPQQQMQFLIELAHKYDFIIASDECYSEIYFDEQNPPGSLLNASNDMGNSHYERMHDISQLIETIKLAGLAQWLCCG